MSLIAHEISHAVHYVLSRKGLQLNDETTEIYAYYTQFLTKTIGRAAFGVERKHED
jgi:hypothetical protein